MLDKEEGGTKSVQMMKKLPPDQQSQVLDAVVRRVREIIKVDPRHGSTYINNAVRLLSEAGTDDTRIACFGNLSKFGPYEGDAAFALAACHGPAGVAIIEKLAEQRLPDLERAIDPPDDEDRRKSNEVLIPFVQLLENLNGSKNVAGPIAAKRLRAEFAKRYVTKNGKIVLAAIDEELAKAALRKSAADKATR